jgi:hypothetical protein
MFSRVLISLGAAYVVSAAASQGIDYRVVALTGDPVPGLREGVYISGFGGGVNNLPQIADDGSVCFVARLAGPAVNPKNDRALCIADLDGGIRVLLRTGQQAPGLSFGELVLNITNINYGRNGDCGFGVEYTDRTGEYMPGEYGVYVADDAGVHFIARLGDPFPGGSPGDVFTRLLTPIPGPGDNGYAALSEGGNDENGLLSIGSGSALIPIARTGDPVPAIGPGVQLGELLFPQHHDTKRVLVRTFLSGAGVTDDNSYAICLASESGVEPIFRQGQMVPDEPPGDLSFAFAAFSSDLSGRVLLRAALQGSSVDSHNLYGLWLRHADGTLTKVMREGDPAPGTEQDTVFNGILGELPDGAGNAVFIATITGPAINTRNDRGLWRGSTHSNLWQVLRAGNPAPRITDATISAAGLRHKANHAGQFVVACTLRGDGVDASNDQALYMLSESQELVLVLRDSETYDVGRAGGMPDLRQLQFFTLYGNYPPFDYASVLNNRNEIVQLVGFQDESRGLLVISLDDGCTADTNGDGSLTPTDFTAWINAFNNSLPECDQNGDGACTPTDFTAWIANYNAGCP